jgi:glycosyltransferase XagB
LDPRGASRAVSARARLRASFSAVTRARTGGRSGLGVREAGLATDAGLDLYLTRQFLPWRRDGEGILIAAADTSAANLAWLRDTYGGAQIFSVTSRDLHRAIAHRFRDRLSDDAVYSLWSKMPRLSARRTVTRSQAVVSAAVGTVVAVACCLWPFAVVEILVAAMSAGFAVSATFRTALALLGGRNKNDSAPRPAEGVLPIYTILVPLYREAKVLPQLVRALSALDYPRDRLDIKFVVEEDDRETCTAAEALTAQGPFEVLYVPYSLPRTKPKACNYALRFARGEYLVIYDAEDRPEPDQLRKAIDRFRKASPETVCLQARLAIYNADDSWLARMFALDYAVWFKALLPGLDKLGVPMPLGGTSNHFRTAILRAAGGWDPFNVTEDADLGIRLAQLGYRVSMLDSTTFEEAPARLGSWLRQRSRWLKGYMQTWLVHVREPVALVRRVGWRGVGVLQLFLGGAIWSTLFNPVLWLIFAFSHVCWRPDGDLQALGMLARISGLGLFAANIMLVGLAICGTRRKWTVVPYALCFPFYWALISIAAYRGLWQLFFKPFYWEKTPHGQTHADCVL